MSNALALRSMSLGKRTVLALVENLIWVILALMLLWAIIFVRGFLSVENLINILYHSSILGMLVLAQAICLISGHFDLSIESTLGFSATIGALTIMNWLPSLPPVLGILITLSVGAVIGLVNALFIVKFRLNAFLMTLAMQIMLRGLLLFLIPKTLSGLPMGFSFLGSKYIGFLPLAVIILVVGFLLMHLTMNKSTLGRQLYAVGGNKVAAFAAGINTDRVLFLTFIMSGILASLAGLIMAGRMQSVTSSMGQGMVFLSFAGAVLGGVSLAGGEGTILGAAAGLILLGTFDNTLNLLMVSPYLVYAIKGFLIFIAINLDNFKVFLQGRLLRD